MQRASFVHKHSSCWELICLLLWAEIQVLFKCGCSLKKCGLIMSSVSQQPFHNLFIPALFIGHFLQHCVFIELVEANNKECLKTFFWIGILSVPWMCCCPRLGCECWAMNENKGYTHSSVHTRWIVNVCDGGEGRGWRKKCCNKGQMCHIGRSKSEA